VVNEDCIHRTEPPDGRGWLSRQAAKKGSSRIGLQTARNALQGRDDPGMSRDVVEWCQDTTVGGGRSTHVWMRRERQRDGSAAGGHENFLEIPIPPSTSPARPTCCRKRTGAGLHEHLMRDLAKPGPRQGRGVPRRGSREGTVRRIAHRVKPEWWAVGALRRERCSRKNADGPLPASIRLPFPTYPGKPGARRPGRRAGNRVAHGEPTAASRHVWRAKKSTMNPKKPLSRGSDASSRVVSGFRRGRRVDQLVFLFLHRIRIQRPAAPSARFEADDVMPMKIVGSLLSGIPGERRMAPRSARHEPA
jgi:hypothetical protein